RVVTLDEMHPRRRVIAEITDFLLAVSGERADRNESRFEAGEESEQQLVRIGDLEDDAVERRQTERKERRRQPVGDLIELAVGVVAARAGERQAVGVPP